MQNPNLTRPIRVHTWDGSTVTIPLFRLIQWKHALTLEAAGMRHSQGDVTALLRRTLNTPTRYPRADLIAYLAATLDDVHDQMMHEGGEA